MNNAHAMCLFKTGAVGLCVLRTEPHGGLSVLFRDRDKNFHVSAVHACRVLRLLGCYVELVLELGSGRVSAFVFPGVCRADAFRKLRKHLLQAETVVCNLPLLARLFERMARKSRLISAAGGR